MIRADFQGGAFVLHRIPHDGIQQVTAWYAPDGNLLDAEGYDCCDRVHAIKPGGPVWRHAQKVGKREAERGTS
jgi:hypothetical protein